MRKIFSLFLMTFVSVMMFAATETTVYYTAPAATIGTYSVKLNVNFKGDGDDWHQFDMTKTALTNNGDPVYSYKYTDAYDGVGVMQFQLYDGETWKSQKVAISSWTAVATYNGKMYVHATEEWVAAPAEGGSEAQVETIYTWYGKRGETSATEAVETGGTAAAYGGNSNIVVGTSQKTNWTMKFNKGFSNANYIGITLNEALVAGDKLQVAAFRTSASDAVFGIDFSEDAENAATTCQILFPNNLQQITTNVAPEDTTFTIPECAAGAKFIRLYRNSGSTGVYVANFTVLREKGGETPDPVEPQPVDSMTVYYVNKSAWENVNAFVWPAEGDAYKAWPGEAMTKEAEQINGFDVYSYTFPASYVNLIFNNGNSGEGNQTSNLVWEAANPYFYDGVWYAKADIPTGGDPIVPPTPVDSMTVYFVNETAWENVDAFVWPAEGEAYKAWPGEAMTKEAEQINGFDVYSYTFPASYVNIIFNNGNSGEGNQTGDLVWEDAKPYFYGGAWYAKAGIPTGGDPQVEEFVGFDARTTNLGEQIEAGLAKNLVNVTFVETSAGKYSVNLVEGGVEGSFSFGGVVFAYTHLEAGKTAFKTYNAYIQPNGMDREVRIPLNAGEKANVILTEACEGVLVNGVSTDLVSGDNILTATEDGLVLKTASTKPKIQAVLPVVVPVDSMTVYYVNETAWENVNAFVWPAEGDAYKAWPGEAMTKEAEQINGFDVYSYTFPASYVNIIFNNGNSGEGNQTGDLVWEEAKPYFYGGAWYAKADIPTGGDPIVPPTPVDSMTVYFVNNLAWEAVNAYVWPAEGDAAYKAWPGEAMTKEAEQINGFDVYSYKFPASYVNIIFNNGNGGEGNQTSNLVWDATKPYFFDGEWYASVEEVAPHCAQVTEGIWTVTETTPLDANSIYVHNNLMKMKPAYAAAWDGFYNPQQFGEYSFTYAMLIRSEAWPTEQIPAGAEYVEGNKNTTSLIVEAKEDIDITIFYRRQTGNQSENDSKDLKIFDHSAITTAIQGVFQIVELDGDYFSATKKLSLVKGHRYTITAKGTTPKIFAIAYGQPAEPDPAKFYVTGDSALIADAASAGTVAWAPNAIKSEKDTLVLNLKAGVDYQLSLTVDGTWNTKKTYANLTQEDKSGLYDVDGENHNIGFKLNEPGEVKVVYFVKDEVVTFELIGNFYVDQTPVIEPEDTYTVAGDNTTLFGSSWDPTDTNNDMTLVEGIYKWEKSEVALAEGPVQFKVVKDHNWNYGSYPADNYQLAIPADGIYTVTITFDPANLTVDATALKTGDAEVEKHYLVVGQAMVANGEDWNNDADINLMTSADEGLTYTLEIADLQLIAGTLYRYKIVEKGSWVEYFPKHVDNSDTCFTVPEDGIYTITYVYTVATSLCEVQAQRTGDLPAARLTDGYYLVGNFSGVPAWSVDGLTDAQRFVEVESDEYGTYYSLTADLAVDDSIKVVKIVHDAIVLWMPEGTGNNVFIDANHAGEAKIIHLDVAVTGAWRYYVEPNIQDGFYLLGSLNNWTPSDEYKFGKDATCGENEFILNTTLTIDDQIKVAKVENGVATTWYPEGEGNNYVVDAAHAGEKAIYFQETYKEDWVAFGGYFWMGENGGTAISNTAADAEAVKVLHNGMLLIRKGDKTYNIMGQAVK